MARTIATDISTALGSDGIYFIDLVEWDLGSKKLRLAHYSNRPLSDGTLPYDSHDGTTWKDYVVSIGKLGWSVGSETDKSVFVFANPLIRERNGRVYYYWKNIIENYVLENTRITIHRLFPGTADPTEGYPVVSDAIEKYWFGHVTGYSETSSEMRVEVTYGFPEVTRRAFRRLSSACSLRYKDGLLCPYDPMSGTGLPQAHKDSAEAGAVISVSGTTVTVLTGLTTGPKPIKKGHYFFCKDTKAIGKITAVTATTMKVEEFVGGIVPNNGDHWIAGPLGKYCDFSKEACKRYGMFGVNNTQVVLDLNTDTRRYMTAQLIPQAVEYRGRKPSGTGRQTRYTRTSESNDGLDGTVLPVLVGNIRYRSSNLIGTADESDAQNQLAYFNGLYILGEGRIKSLTIYDVGGIPLDVDSSSDHSGERYKNAMVEWGTDKAVEDNSDGFLSTEQDRMAVGSRAAWSTYVGGTSGAVIDQYESNPYLFNTDQGDGVSLAGALMVRIRLDLVNTTDPQEGNEADIAIHGGIFCRDIDGDGWKHRVNPIDFAFEFVRNSRWGIGLNRLQVDTTAAEIESDYCDEKIGATQTQVSDIECEVAHDPLDLYNWPYDILEPDYTIMLKGVSEEEAPRYVDGRLKIPSRNFDSEIKSAGQITFVEDPDALFPTLTGIAFVVADKVVDSGYGVGDSVRLIISPESRTIRRFECNGIADWNVDSGEALEAILDNCDGTYYIWGDQLKFHIPKALTVAEMTTVDSETAITDKGLNPSVIFRDGKSTIKWREYRTDESFNQLLVSFPDANNYYENTTIPVKNDDAISKMSEVYGSASDAIFTKDLSLGLTRDRDQAVRIASRRIRRKGMVYNKWRNGEITFEWPVHDAMELEPVVSVRRIISDLIPKWFTHVRIMKIEESEDRITCKIKSIPYHRDQYSDSALMDFGQPYTSPSVNKPRLYTPAPLYVKTVADEGYYDDDGKRQELVKLTVKLPETRPVTRR